MYYSKETISEFGYASAEEFVVAYTKQHGNCCICLTGDGGVVASYDLYTSPGLTYDGYHIDEGGEI